MGPDGGLFKKVADRQPRVSEDGPMQCPTALTDSSAAASNSNGWCKAGTLMNTP